MINCVIKSILKPSQYSLHSRNIKNTQSQMNLKPKAEYKSWTIEACKKPGVRIAELKGRQGAEYSGLFLSLSFNVYLFPSGFLMLFHLPFPLIFTYLSFNYFSLPILIFTLLYNSHDNLQPSWVGSLRKDCDWSTLFFENSYRSQENWKPFLVSS
jgi:hypothetical protein